MREIRAEVSKPYSICIGSGILDCLASNVKPILTSERLAIVTDDIVEGLYLKRVKEALEKEGLSTVAFVFPNGEQSKNIETLSDILEFLAKNHIRRNDTLIALGGGVVGDITGLAAALYMRGIQVIQIPTTLLSAVDSSVGGKTAVDLKNGKNLAGAFWQPGLVFCDVAIIKDLPEDIFAEGMAEAIKCNVIRKLPIISRIEEGTLKENLEEVIACCIDLKREIVEQDEFDEKGIRNILNAGHTIAHAVEKLSGYTVSHGKAVGTGLVIEAGLAKACGLMKDDRAVETIRKAVQRFGLMVDIPWDAETLTNAMRSDKKNRSSAIVFELPTEIGHCQEISLEYAEVVEKLRGCL